MRRLPLLLALAVLLAAPAAATAAVNTGPIAADGFAFTTAAGTQRTTGVRADRRDGDARVLTYATTDPTGRTLTFHIASAGDGITAVTVTVDGATADVQATSATFARVPGERHFGFGERADVLDHAGRDIEDVVSDGPFTAHTRPFVAATIPPQGYRARDDATYYPVPWMLSSRGYGVLVDNGQPSRWRLGTERKDAWSVEADAPVLRLRVFAGPTPALALRRFTAATGRQPAPQAPWAYGPWLQTGQASAPPVADERADFAKLLAADAPVSAAETQMRYLPCGLDRGNEAYEKDRVSWYHARGLAVLTYVNPMVCATYDPVFGDTAAARGLQRDALGQPAVFQSFVGGIGPAGFTILPVAQFDFTGTPGRAAYRQILQRIVDAGHDGWMEDFGEYTPSGVVSADGTPSDEIHNRYPVAYHCAVHDIVGAALANRPLVRFQRSGWTGAARCADDVWGGDPTTDFGFDGLRSQVTAALGMGMSGISRWGSDIGGYDTLGDDPQLTPELLQRWIAFGAVSGVMRMKKSGLALPSYTRPQPWDPGIIATWRRFTKLHTQLYPYIAAAERTYRLSGMPLMRALALTDPADPRAAAADDEFRFGPDLLAAPVVTRGATTRRLYLPRGRWLDGAAALRYDTKTGGLHAGAAPVVRGGQDVTVPAPRDVLPLFVRAGAVLPLLTPDVFTLSDYGAGRAVRLADRRDRLVLLAFPRGHWRGTMYEGEPLRSDERRGRWTLRIARGPVRRYTVEAVLRWRVCSVRVGGRSLRRGRAWRYDRRRHVLRATVRGGPVRLVARGC